MCLVSCVMYQLYAAYSSGVTKRQRNRLLTAFMCSRGAFSACGLKSCLVVPSAFAVPDRLCRRAFHGFAAVVIVDGVHAYVYAGIFPIAQSGNTTRGWINETLYY